MFLRTCVLIILKRRREIFIFFTLSLLFFLRLQSVSVPLVTLANLSTIIIIMKTNIQEKQNIDVYHRCFKLMNSPKWNPEWQKLNAEQYSIIGKDLHITTTATTIKISKVGWQYGNRSNCSRSTQFTGSLSLSCHSEIQIKLLCFFFLFIYLSVVSLLFNSILSICSFFMDKILQ